MAQASVYSAAPARRRGTSCRIALVVVVTGLALVTTIQPGHAATQSLTKAIAAYAPLVYLHPDETLYPMEPRVFILQSELKWAHDDKCRDHSIDGAGVGVIDPARLKAGSYPHHQTNHPALFHPAPFCQHDNNDFSTAQHTRPFDTLGAEGFYLDFQGDRRGALLLESVPVYYEYVPKGRYIHYWFFFAYNNYDGPGPFNQFHEGDWERISVRLNAENAATSVAFWGHGGYCTKTWGAVTRYKTSDHPVVYSALGSHASYPAAGSWPINVDVLPDQTDRAARSTKAWKTWVHPVSATSDAEGWYGYGGAWGQVDGPGPVAHKDFTGPLGPSTFKNDRSPITTWNRPCPKPT